MSAVPKLADKKSLRNLVPLSGLSNAHFEELAKKATVLELRPGKYLFKKGERDNSTCYVLSGEIALIDKTDIKLTIQGGTEEAKHPIAPQQPRQLSARAKTKTTIISIDSGLLDVMLAWEQSSSYEIAEADVEEDEDWMSRLMQSDLLQQLPATNLQQLFIRMQEIDVKAGEVIVNQDDEGDYYYIIKKGTCVVSRRPSAKAKAVKLAELSDGASFGEESLLSGAKRNATVTMLTAGQLMRLSKKDFNELLKAPLLSEISYSDARRLQQDGAIYLDVRLPGEYSNAHLSDSINVPLAAIRSEITNIDKEKTYIAYCDTGRRSTSAVFLLGQFGIEAHILKGGLSSVPIEEYTKQEQAPAETTDSAEVIDINRDKETASAIADEESAKAQASGAEIEALKTEIASLTEKLSVAQKQVEKQAQSEQLESELLAQVQEMDAEVVALKKSLEQVQQESNKKTALLDQADKSSSKKLKIQAEKLAKVEKDLQSAHAVAGDADSLKEQNLALQLEKKQFSEELKKAQEQNDVLNKGKQEVNDQLNKVRTELESAEQGKDRAAAELTQALARLDKSEKTVGEHKQQLDTMTGKLEKLEADKLLHLKDADSSLSELNSTLEELRQDKLNVENSLGAEKEISEKLKQQLNEQTEKEKSLSSELDQVRVELQNEKNIEKDLREEKDRLIADLENIRNEYQIESEKLKNQAEHYSGQVESAKNDQLKLEQALAQSNEKILLLEEQVVAQTKISEQVENTASAVNDQLKQDREKIHSLEQQLKQQQAQSEEDNKKSQAINEDLQQSAEKIKSLEVQLNQQLSVVEQVKQEGSEYSSELQSKLEVAEEKYKNMESVSRDVEQKNKDLETLLNSLKESNASAEKANTDKLQTLEMELEKISGEKQELGHSLSQTEDNINNVRQELEAARFEKQQAEQKAGALNAELTELKELSSATGNELETQISALQRQLGEVASVKYTLTEELEAARAKASELDQKNKELESGQQSSQSGLQKKVEDLQAALADTEETLELTKQQLSEKDGETSDVNKELAALRALYAQKESDVTRLQNDLDNINLKVDDYRQKDDEVTQAKHKIEEELRLTQKELELSVREHNEKFKVLENELEQKNKEVEQAMLRADKEVAKHSDADVSFQQSDRESSERIQALENELEQKNKAIQDVMHQAEQATSLKTDAEGAFQLLEQEIEQLREQDDGNRKALISAQEELKQVRQDRQRLNDQLESASPQVDRDFAQSRIVELEGLVKDGQNGMAEARIRIEKLEHELSMEKHNADMDNNLQGQIEKLKKEMEVQLDQYKSEIDSESTELQKENESLREELKEYFSARNEAIDTGSSVDVKKSNPKSIEAEQDEMVDTSALFDLPDIDRNLFNNSMQQEPAKTSFLMVASIAFLFSIISAGAVYWYFVLRVDTGASKSPVVVEKKVAKPAPVKSVKPVEQPKSKIVVNKKSVKPLFNFSSKSDKPVKVDKKITGSRKMVATTEFRDRLVSGGRGPTMIGVPGGTYVMGSPSSSVHFDERPAHPVSITAFSISRHEVTFSQYDVFAAATGRSRPSDNGWGRGTRPVVNVSWSDAVAYTKWLSKETGHVYRLPSEAQWEYAARAGTTTKYWWGSRAGKNKANCFNCGSKWDRISTAPVGSFDTNSLGLHDMLGNAMEWVADCYHGNFNGAPVDGSVWAEKSCASHVARGGAYLSTSENIRISKRSEFNNDISLDQLGFRVVRIR